MSVDGHELVEPALSGPKASQWDRHCETTARGGYGRLPLWAELSGRVVFHNNCFTDCSKSVVDKGEAASYLENTNCSHILETTNADNGYWCKRVVVIPVAIALLFSTSARMSSVGYISAMSSDAVPLRASLATSANLPRDIRTCTCSCHLGDSILCKVFLDTADKLCF